MRKTRAIAMVVLAVSALSAGSATSALAATHHSSMDSLVVKITKANGIVWGKVTVDYMQNGKLKMLGACHQAKCTFHPPHMVKLILHEKPTNAATWPFHGWKLVNGGMKAQTSMNKTLKFEIQHGMATVWAKYILKI